MEEPGSLQSMGSQLSDFTFFLSFVDNWGGLLHVELTVDYMVIIQINRFFS